MNKLIALVIIACFPMFSFAAESCNTQTSEEVAQEAKVISTDVPSHLKGAVIIVRQADGRESVVPAEKFKVVPRKQQYLVTKTKQASVTKCSQERLKNRISLLGGEGPKKKVSVSSDANSVTMESKSGAVGGIQYQRSLTERINVGAEVLSNETGLVSIGLDF